MSSDEFKKLEEFKKNKDYVSYMKTIAENDNEIMKIFLSLSAIDTILEMLSEYVKSKSYEEAINKLDEIIEIEGLPINIKSFCLNRQGLLLINISKKNLKNAFDKFYTSFELMPRKETAEYVAKAFPFGEDSNVVQIYINKVLKYKEFFPENFLSRLGLYEMLIYYDIKDYDKAYDIGVSQIPKISETFKDNREAISAISYIFIITASEIYSKYIQKKDINSAEKIYDFLINNLKYKEDKERTKILFGIMLIISNEFELAFSKFDSMEEQNVKLKAFCYGQYIKTNLNQKTNFEKCLNYINILKSLDLKEDEIKNEINNLDFLIFIRKCEIEFEKKDFSSYEKIEKMLEKETDIKKRIKLENLKKELIKKKKDFYFKEKNFNEFLKDNTEMMNVISEIYQEESLEEVEKKNFNSALNKIEKALEIEPKNIKYMNDKAYINTEKGNYEQAIKDIDSAMKFEPESKILQNNKIVIIDKKYENNNNKIDNKEKEYIEKKILDNSDIKIQQNSIDLSLKLTKNRIQEIGQEKMNDLINNNILPLKGNDYQNITIKENKKDEKEKIILASKSSELILENIKNNNINELNKDLKNKIEKCLDIKEKDVQSNLLCAYSYIKNLKKEEMTKPLEIINKNLKYEVNNKEIIQNIDTLENFMAQDKNLDIKSDIASNLLEVVLNNDYTKYTEEDKEKDEISDNKKPLFQYFKDKTKEGIARQLKETINEYSYDEKLHNQIKKDAEQFIDIENNLLKDSQKEKKETNQKIFNCIQNIAKSKNGLTEQNLENMGLMMEKIEDTNSSKEYQNFVKKNIVETINIALEQQKNQKLPDNLMNNLSRELKNNSIENKDILNILDKASDNQKLTEETQDNIINILADKDIENKSEINKDDKNYEIAYQILNKDYQNLSEIQKKVVDLEKNTISINKEKNENTIIHSLDNISSIVNDGYSINKHTEKTILNLLNNNSENENYLVKSTEVINNMAKNSMNISNEMTDFIVKKIEDNKIKPKLSKKAFTELLACLVNIIDNCNIPEKSVEAFQKCLNDYKNKDKNAELKLAITGLSILSKKHYSLNKEAINSCLDIIESNILEEQSLKELSDIIDIIFKETEIDNNTFTKLVSIIIKNPNLLDKLSICLINSLKFKNDKEIEGIITENLKNFETMIKNQIFNENIINIIKLVNINFYQNKNQFLSEFYNFYILYSKNKLNGANYKTCKNFISKYGILDAKYLSVVYNNLSNKEDLDFLEKILEKNPKFINQEMYDKMLKIRIESNLFQNILKMIKKFSNYFLPKETIDILCEKCQTNKKEIYAPIYELMKIFSEKNNNNISEINFKNKDILEIELMEEKNSKDIDLISKFIDKSSFVPDRYFNKLLQIMVSKSQLFNSGFNKFLLAVNKNLIIPNEIIEKLLDYKNEELHIKLLQSLLINKNYNKKLSKKLLNILEENSKESNIQIINSLQSLIVFANLDQLIN